MTYEELLEENRRLKAEILRLRQQLGGHSKGEDFRPAPEDKADSSKNLTAKERV